MHVPCMATKTISIDLEAYNKLSAARLDPNESFSKVIRRARWDDTAFSGEALLNRLESLPAISEAALKELELNQQADLPPRDKWSV
jgi:Putative antitoxin